MTDILIAPPGVPPATRIMSIPEVARAAWRNPLEIVPALAYRQPIVSGRTVLRWHMLMDPGGLRQVLLSNVDNYPKSRVTLRLLRPAIGESLFTAHGEHWRWQRRAAAPAFQHRKLLAFAPMMTAAAVATLERMRAAPGGRVDAATEMTAATFEVVCDALLSGRVDLDRTAVADAITRYLGTVGRISFLDVLGLPNWIPRPGQFMGRGAIWTTQEMMESVIAARRAEGEPRGDLLDLMLAAEDPETGRRMTDTELRDNLLAFLVAGHETTALALAWSIWLLAAHPGFQQRAAEQARAVLGDRPAEAGDLDRLGYIRQVVEEAMRLYPPAAMISRQALAPDTLCGREVRRGDTVLIPIYTLHRNTLLWDRPDDFDPDNFAPARVKARDRFAYLPFGAGPRICIGLNFAMIEATIILATLVASLRFEPHPTARPRPVMTMTLRPEGGAPVIAHPRAS